MIVKCYILLTLSLGIAHGQLLLSPVIAESCSTINISAVYLNMSDPSQPCPSNWTRVNSPIRGCRRTTSDHSDCDSVYYSVGGSYSRICGRTVVPKKDMQLYFITKYIIT